MKYTITFFILLLIKGEIMLYETIEIEDLITEKDSEKEIVELLENNGSHLKLIYLKKHEEIEPHMSHTNACIYMTEGEIEFILSHEDNCTCQACGCSISEEDNKEIKKFKIKKGQLFLFEKNIMHSVKALKDSTFLLIKI